MSLWTKSLQTTKCRIRKNEIEGLKFNWEKKSHESLNIPKIFLKLWLFDALS